MDLGATVCVRRNPVCEACPLSDVCVARAQGRQHDYPAPRRVTARRKHRSTAMLVLRLPNGEVWLKRRPPQGIWGGLWAPPEFADPVVARASVIEAGAVAAANLLHARNLPLIEHAFTHFDLTIAPVLADIDSPNPGVREDDGCWY